MLEIVVHAYAEVLDQYAQFLRFQLSSLVLNPTEVPIRITTCFTPRDERIGIVLAKFAGKLPLNPLPLQPEDLFRRSIGRNQAALSTEADLVFFTDVDYCFYDDCLDSLWAQWNKLEAKPSLLWIRQIQIHKDHEIGDRLIAWARESADDLLRIDPADFKAENIPRAIGGVQIISGDDARTYGYLNDRPKWRRPSDNPFVIFSDDIIFRESCEKRGKSVSIILPGLYRLRHSKTTYGGDRASVAEKTIA